VHSVLSLPLISADTVVGAMNVYAHPRGAFDERAEQLGQLFAVPAAIAVQNAQILAQTQRLAATFQAWVSDGLRTRASSTMTIRPQHRHTLPLWPVCPDQIRRVQTVLPG
jgi:GAF domain-containing protein